MERYSPTTIESKWQRLWEEEKLYQTNLSQTPKFYCLVMFPYPSSDKLHIGHWYNYGPTDTFARFKRMQGFNVFEPIGFDAFGLPAENYAIKTGVHPQKSTEENIEYIRKQLKQIGTMYDWSKEIITCHPNYYQWTQWLFLQLFKNGLAERKLSFANYCPSCKTVLANEQVKEGRCERCDSEVIQKELEQWFFKITNYAERLLSNLKKLNWPLKTKLMQEHWIGKSEGAIIQFPIEKTNHLIEVFTTRPDTLFGATYLVISPEKWHHSFSFLKTTSEVDKYIKQSEKKTYFQRQFSKEKSGVFTGFYALNPVNKQRIPIWVADYVLPDYGTGAIMCVPAHDERDFEFAQKYHLPIIQVVKPPETKETSLQKAYSEPGIMINSGRWDGMSSEAFKEEVVQYLSQKGLAKKTTYYKLRDWLISRQRYWGAPIPLIYCPNCAKKIKEGERKNFSKGELLNPGWIAVPEKALPVLLPKEVNFQLSGQSPLASVSEFLHTKCPKCGSPARREVDTMDTFVCSSWYFLRYLSPQLENKPFDKTLVNKWLPVDLYVGGAEHATMHLIYARFITMVLHDLGFIDVEEPFARLYHQGTITHKGAKMSKSRGNVVIPDHFVKKYGSDSFRMYLMFMGPYDEGGDWSDYGIVGVYRFLNRVWTLVQKVKQNKEKITFNAKLEQKLHQTIKKITKDLENLRFNTAIATLMQWLNLAYNNIKTVDKEMLDTYLKLIAPFAPHLAEELWHQVGHPNSIFKESWPHYRKELIAEQQVTIIIEMNGKVRDKLTLPITTEQKEIEKLAQSRPKVQQYLQNKEIKKIIHIPGRLINFVLK